MARSQPGSRERHVTALLLAGQMAPEAVGDIVEAGLAAYALDRLGDGAVHDAALLRSARLMAGVRHAATRGRTIELVRAFRDVGIDSLLFKGFYLAEFLYPEPNWRPYSDVDLVLRSSSGASPHQVAGVAAAAARDAGFKVVWHLGETPTVHSFHDPRYNGHELLQLVHPDTGTSVDAHRRLVHSNVSLRPQSDMGEILTRRVWEASETVELGGVPVYVPAAIDSALVGLITARSWSGDRHAVRPHDLLDLDVLMRRGGFGRAELLARAGELGLTATTTLFLRRCDPVSGSLDLRTPTRTRAFVYDAQLLGERGHRGLAQAGAALTAAPGRLLDVVRELPSVAKQVARVRAGHPPRWSSVGEFPNGRPLDRRTWRATQVGVRRALRLLGMPPEGHRELALASLHGSIARRRFELNRIDQAGRTWFEFQGRELPLDQLGRPDESEVQEGLRGWSLTPTDPAVGPAAESPTGPIAGAPSSHATTWQRLRAIGWSGMWLRLEALLLLRRITAALGSKPFREVRADLLRGRASGSAAGAPESAPTYPGAGRPVGRAVESAARFVPGALCVAQALTGQVMLARRDQSSTIHFGFLRSPAGTVEGHAWLEVGDTVIVGDGSLDTFTRTATFDS